MISIPPPALLTLGRIASELGQPLHRIQYVLRTRKAIQPTARAGALRLYDRNAVEAIRSELVAMASRKSDVPALTPEGVAHA